MKWPVWSPGRARRAFCLVACAFLTHSLERPDAARAAPVTRDVRSAVSAPLIGRIAFERYVRASDPNRSTSTLYVLDLVTNAVQRVGEKRYPDAYARLTWTPDGSAITFVANVDRARWRGQLYRVGVDGRNLAPLYPSDSNDSYPAWSRDWRLAYTHTPGEGIAGPVYVNGTLYFAAEAALSRPAWSPDGSVLLVPHLNGVVYRVRGDGQLFEIFIAPEVGVTFSSPAYSPDGMRVALAKRGGVIPQGQSEIWIVNADATLPIRLTSGALDDAPAWSPDGLHVAFQRTSLVTYVPAILVMDSDGGNVVTLIEDASDPAWAP